MVALARSVKHFLRSFLDNGEAIVDGVKLLTDEKLIGNEARRFILAGTYEEPERELVKLALSPDDRVLEFGGCLGLLSLLCARIVGERNVLCYEANPVACRIIEKNYALNTLHPELREKALTVEGGDVQFYQTDNLFSSSIYDRHVSGSRISVPSDKFSDVVRTWRPTAIVMDVEGAECELIPSSNLKGVSKIVLETHKKIVGPEKTDELLAHLASIGFELQAQSYGRGYFRRA